MILKIKILIFTLCILASYQQRVEEQPQLMRVTCYVGGYVTASGTEPREGICAAKREWIGSYAMIFDSEMNFVTMLKIEDTGGHYRITSGQSIDIWKPSMYEAKQHIAKYGDYMYVKIIQPER